MLGALVPTLHSTLPMPFINPFGPFLTASWWWSCFLICSCFKEGGESIQYRPSCKWYAQNDPFSPTTTLLWLTLTKFVYFNWKSNRYGYTRPIQSYIPWKANHKKQKLRALRYAQCMCLPLCSFWCFLDSFIIYWKGIEGILSNRVQLFFACKVSLE